MEKQSDIQRKQMLDKVNQLNLQITAEKDTREVWINRYEKEQKAHIQTHTESMEFRAKNQELQLKIESDHANLQAQTESKATLKQHLSDLQFSYTEVLTQSEKQQRDIVSKQDLIQQMTANNELLVRKMKRDILALETKNLILEETHGLRFEDLRTFCTKQFQ